MNAESRPPPVEIAAEKRRDRHLAGMAMIFAYLGVPLAILGWLFGGPRQAALLALSLLIALVIVAILPRFVRRKDNFVRATLTQDGVTVDGFHFDWGEIKSVSRPVLLRGVWLSSLTILLNRPRKFWTFSVQPADRITLPAPLWRQPPFLNELKSRLPENCQRALEEAPPIPWQYGLAPLACTVITAALAILLATDATGWIVQAIAISALLTAGATAVLAGAVWVEDEAKAADALRSAFYPLLLWAMIGFFVFVASGRLPLLVGMVTGIAAACSLPGIMILAGCRRVRWSHAGSVYALAAVGFLAGWFGCGGISDVQVAEGAIGYRSPWTPSGDGFLISLAESGEKTTFLRWYSAGLKPECDVHVPDRVNVEVVGADSALCQTAHTSKDGHQEIWFISRHDGTAKRILADGTYRVHSASPSRNYAVICSEDKHDQRSWYLVNMYDGRMRPFALPEGFDGAQTPHLMPRDYDGRILLMEGSLPRDKNNNRVDARTELPASGSFPHLGDLFSIWLWNPTPGDHPPDLIYGAKEPWLEYRRRTPLYGDWLYVCRVAGPPPHKEYVALDLMTTPISEVPADEKSFLGDIHDPSFPRSRFFVSQQRMFMAGRLLVTNNRSRRTRYLRTATGPLGICTYFLSPTGDKMLVETWRFHGYLRHTEPGADIPIRSTVHFVDLADAFR